MHQINCYIPIKVCVRGYLSDAQLAELGSTLAGALTARLEFAEKTIASGDGHLQRRETGILQAVYDPSREDVASVYKIPSYDGPGETKRIPIRRAGSPWFIRRAIDFKAYVNQFLDVVDSWKSIPEKDLYADIEGELRRVSAWLVQVNREYLFTDIVRILRRRAEGLSRLRAGQGLFTVVAGHEDLRKQLIEIDQSNIVAREIPVIDQNSKLIRAKGSDFRLLPGARLLHASMVLPKIELKDRADISAGIQITVRLRDLTFLVNPVATYDRFKQKHALEWDTYVKEFGDKPERVHLHPVTVQKRTERSVLKTLVEDALSAQIRGEMGNGSRLWGDLYLLNNATLAKFPPYVRNKAGSLTNDLTRPIDPSKSFNVFEPNWKAAYVYTILTPTLKTLSVARYRPNAGGDVERLISHLGKRLVTWRERWGFIEFARKNLYGFFPAYFEVLLDELKSRDGGRWFDRFFARVKEALDYDLRLDVIRSVKETKYANDPGVLDLVRHHNEIERARSTGNVYDVANQKIILNKFFGDETVSVNEILYEVWDSYSHEEKRYRPKSSFKDKWAAELLLEGLALVGRIASEEDAKGNDVGYTDEEFAEAVTNALFTKLGITEDNFANYFDVITIQLSVRFLGLRRYIDEFGVESIGVLYRVVEREEGGSWDDIGEILEARDYDFDYKIDQWVHARVSSAIITIAHISLAIAAVGVAWEFGIIAPLLRLGGGARIVLPSILVSTIFEFVMHGVSWESFLFGVINGYLGALFFRGAGGLARALFGRSNTSISFREGVIKWIGIHMFKGTIGGGSTGAGLRFTRDVYMVATGRGTWSSPGEYASSIGWGVALGIGAEFAGPLVLEPIGARVFGSARDVGKFLLDKKVTHARWQTWAVDAKSKIGQRLASLLERQPGKAATIRDGIKLLYEQVGEAFAGLGAGIRGRIQLSVFRQLLEFSGAELTPAAIKGLEKFLRGSARHLDENAALDVVKRMFAPGNAGRDFLAALSGLEDDAIKALMRRGELEGWLLVFEKNLALTDKVQAGLARLYKSTVPKDVLDDLVRGTPRDTLPELLGFLGSLEQGVVNELAALGWLSPLARTPRVVAFVREPGNLDALRRIVASSTRGRATAANVEDAITSLESLLKTNPGLTTREIEAASAARRPKLDKSAQEEEFAAELQSGKGGQKKGRRKGKGAAEAAEQQTVSQPAPQPPAVVAYNNAKEAFRRANNEVIELEQQLQQLRKVIELEQQLRSLKQSGESVARRIELEQQLRSLKQSGESVARRKDLDEADLVALVAHRKDLEEGLAGAKIAQENAKQAAARAEQFLRDSTLELHEKLGAICRNRTDYLNIKRLAEGIDAEGRFFWDRVGNFKVRPPKTIEPDHLISIRRLTTDPKFSDFLRLRNIEDQVAIANLRDNLIAMSKIPNISKLDRPWHSWPQRSQYYTSDVVEHMIREEARVEKLILEEIAKRLGTAKK